MSSNVSRDPSEGRRWGVLAWGSLGAALALAVGWTIVWFAASSAAERRLDSFFETEAAQRRVWSCPARRVEGFPFRFSVVCDEPTFAGSVDGAEIRARVARLAAEASLSDIGRVEIEFGGPLALATADEGVELALGFRRLGLELRVSLEKLQRAVLRGEELEIHWNGPDGAIDGRAREVELAAEPVENARSTYDIAVKGQGLAFPELDAFAQSSDPASLSVDARLSSVAALAAGRGAGRLESWRAAHGRLTLGQSRLVKGALEVTASGELGLDDSHRLEGRVEIGERGADPILLRLGVPPAALGVANALGSLLRGGAAGAPAVRLPLALRDGKAAIGPLRNVFPLKPLY